MRFSGLIVRNLARRSRRTVLTVVTIAMATLAFAMLMAVPASMDRIIDSAAKGQRLIVTNRSGPYGITARYCDDIKKLPHVTGCVAEMSFYLLYRNDSDWVGITAADTSIINLYPDYGIPAGSGDALRFLAEKRAAVVGAAQMKKNHWKIGQQITLRNQNNQLKMEFIIVSEVPPAHYPNVFLIRRDYPFDTIKAIGGTEPTNANLLIVRVDSADNLGLVAHAIDASYRNSDAETRSQTETNSIVAGLSNIGSLRTIIFSLCAVVILTVLLIAANSMAMNVRDRMSEVALLRTLGFGAGSIALLLFGEAAILGIIGGAIGAGLAYGLFASGVQLSTITGGLGLISVTPQVAIEAISVAIAVSLISGTLPILSALRIAPAIGLRKVV